MLRHLRFVWAIPSSFRCHIHEITRDFFDIVTFYILNNCSCRKPETDIQYTNAPPLYTYMCTNKFNVSNLNANLLNFLISVSAFQRTKKNLIILLKIYTFFVFISLSVHFHCSMCGVYV